MKKILTAAQKRKIEKAQAMLREVYSEAFPNGYVGLDREAARVGERLLDAAQFAGSALKD